MTDNPDLAEAIRLLRIMRHGEQNPGPAFGCVSPQQRANVDAFLLRHPEKPKLLPCPFCGGEAATINLGSTWIAACRRPGPSRELSWCARTATWADEDDAIAAWNRRAKPASGPVDGGKPE